MKTKIDDIIDERKDNIYNMISDEKPLKKIYGLNEEVIRELSKEKNEPSWILDIRLKALKLFYELKDPSWGPDISYLDINKIATYVKQATGEKRSWEDVPKSVRDVFDKLGIPEAEKSSLAGVGAQFDSEIIYHNLSKEMEIDFFIEGNHIFMIFL